MLPILLLELSSLKLTLDQQAWNRQGWKLFVQTLQEGRIDQRNYPKIQVSMSYSMFRVESLAFWEEKCQMRENLGIGFPFPGFLGEGDPSSFYFLRVQSFSYVLPSRKYSTTGFQVLVR